MPRIVGRGAPTPQVGLAAGVDAQSRNEILPVVTPPGMRRPISCTRALRTRCSFAG
jgi:hypothetical protein